MFNIAVLENNLEIHLIDVEDYILSERLCQYSLEATVDDCDSNDIHDICRSSENIAKDNSNDIHDICRSSENIAKDNSNDFHDICRSSENIAKDKRVKKPKIFMLQKILSRLFK